MYMDVNELLKAYNLTVEGNRITISLLCDSTSSFLYGMRFILEQLRCTDIVCNGSIVSEGIPKDKPWCNYKYEVSGTLPDNLEYKDGLILFKGVNNNYQESALYKYVFPYFAKPNIKELLSEVEEKKGFHETSRSIFLMSNVER